MTDSELHTQRVETASAAWAAHLPAAGYGRYADASIDMLDDLQHPAALGEFAKALGAPDAPVRTLILTGPIGTGKTTAAIAVANAAVARGISVKILRHQVYVSWLRPDGAPKGETPWAIRDRYRRCGLLILDDLGAEMDREQTDFVRAETLDLVEGRAAAGRPLLVTMNLKADELKDRFGERLYSRLGEHAVPLRFTGADRRKPVTW